MSDQPTDKPSGGDDPWVSQCCSEPYDPSGVICPKCKQVAWRIRRSTREAIKAEGAREERERYYEVISTRDKYIQKCGELTQRNATLEKGAAKLVEQLGEQQEANDANT